MMTMTRAAAAALLCLAAACGDGGGEDAGGQPGEGGQSGTAPAVQNIPRGDQSTAAGNLSPVNNSGVAGAVNFRAVGEQTEVSLNVTGASEGNQQLQGAIVSGTCEQPGAELAPVGPIPVGTGNIATVTDTVPMPAATLLNGASALLVKGQNAGPSTPALACAALPKWDPGPPVG